MKFVPKILVVCAALCAIGAHAADPKLALVYGSGGKFDKSFNQSAYEGAERFKKDT
jgi:basic membrane protein A